MATQRSIQRRAVAFQEEMREVISNMETLLASISEKLEATQAELHETKLAVLRTERKLKEMQEGKDEETT